MVHESGMGDPIGFVGVGNMGRPMAGRLIAAGHRLVVYDANPDALARLEGAGARPAGSASEVGDLAETVLVSLPTPDIVESVILGDGGVASGSLVRTIVDLSTTGPNVETRIGERLSALGKTLVDSPVSGGPGGARAGTLAVMVAGSKVEFDRLRPVLSTIGRLFWVGERPGMGQTMKLINNLLSGAAMAISSEALVMGVKAGLDPGVMCEVINAGSGRNSATQDKFPKTIIPRTFDYGFATGLMFKDIKLFIEEAEALGLSLDTAGAVRDLWQRTIDEMGPGSDFTTIVQTVERRAGVQVGGRPSP